jgi:hypothetical protein
MGCLIGHRELQGKEPEEVTPQMESEGINSIRADYAGASMAARPISERAKGLLQKQSRRFACPHFNPGDGSWIKAKMPGCKGARLD